MDGYTYPKPRGDSGTVTIGDGYSYSYIIQPDRYIHTNGVTRRIPNVNAAYSCAERNPDCDRGEQCSLHKYCGAWGPGRGGGIAQAW